jgi:hypothetical protein
MMKKFAGSLLVGCMVFLLMELNLFACGFDEYRESYYGLDKSRLEAGQTDG